MICKKLLKNLCPPIFISLRRHLFSKKYGFFGNYSSWEEAVRDSIGYDDPRILDKMKELILSVKEGKISWELNSPFFLAGLFKAYLDAGQLKVLDFGGSLGSTYYQNKPILEKVILKNIKQLKWAIVEQNNFVATGQKLFADDVLKFYSNLEQCLVEIVPNVVVLSAVIRHIEKPFELFKTIISRAPDYILFDRTPVIQDKTMIVVQKASFNGFTASFPVRLFNQDDLISYFSEKYKLLIDFKAYEGEQYCGNIIVKNKGFIFQRKRDLSN